MPTRKDFLKLTGAAAGALAAGATPTFADPPAPGADPALPSPARPPSAPLRILILGGTGFIGPHLVNTALERGHELTLFNRGRSEPRIFVELFDGLENLIGDRDGDIEALRGRTWDAVIDDSGYRPGWVRDTAQLLKGSVDQYLFTSSRAAYADFDRPGIDESAPVGMPGVPEDEWEGYGPMKALAEREVRRAFPEGATITRPSIITGPGDPTDRMTYWYARIDRGGEVLAPGAPTDPMRYMDVRDLAEFYIHVLERRTTGTFNLVGPASPLSSSGFLYGIRAITTAPISFTWVDWDFLLERGMEPMSGALPGWRPPRGRYRYQGLVDNAKAIEAGLTFRPLAETAMDTLAWWKGLPAERRSEMQAGMSPERERALLEAWERTGRGG